MSQKQCYRIRNWRDHNRALVQRGSLTLWFTDEVVEQWYHHGRNGRRGRDCTYSDGAIQCLLVIKQVFHLPLRALSGLARSLVQLLGLDLMVPSYSQVCRRQGTPARLQQTPNLAQGRPLRGQDTNTHQVVAALVTTNGVGDGEVLPALLDQFDDPIGRLSADGAYDRDGPVFLDRERGADKWISARV